MRRKILGRVERRANDRRAAIPKTSHCDAWQASRKRVRYARVDPVGAGGCVNVDIDEIKRDAVVAEPHLVNHVGARCIDPANGTRPSADGRSVRGLHLGERMIFPCGGVVAEEEHAINGALVVGVIDLAPTWLTRCGSATT